MPIARAIPQEFSRELEAQEQSLMRTRLLWYLIVSNVLNVIGLFFSGMAVVFAEMGFFDVLMVLSNQSPGDAEYNVNRVTMWSSFLLSIPGIAMYAWALWRVYGKPVTRSAGLRLVYWLIMAPAIIVLVGNLLTAKLGGIVLDAESSAQAFSRSIGVNGALTVFFSHFFACLFLPWSPRESMRPMLPLIALNAIITLYTMWGDWIPYAVIVASSVLLMLPGTLLCWLKRARFMKIFSEKQYRTKYGEMKHELSAARQIHDAMFPAPITDGPVRVVYEYEPMRQIGGDYVYVRRDPKTGNTDVVLIDVTGHGVGAALTVNRLHGEVNRLLAERPEAGPGELLSGLNRYLHITLAEHSVYATAFCMRIEPSRDVLRYANAGHPPAFLVRPGGKPEHLTSTTFLLGVCLDHDFDPDEQLIDFSPGDRLLAYTDGATEALDEKGRQLRVGGLERLVAKLGHDNQRWTKAIAHAVEAHRDGPPTDDTLIIEVSRHDG